MTSCVLRRGKKLHRGYPSLTRIHPLNRSPRTELCHFHAINYNTIKKHKNSFIDKTGVDLRAALTFIAPPTRLRLLSVSANKKPSRLQRQCFIFAASIFLVLWMTFLRLCFSCNFKWCGNGDFCRVLGARRAFDTSRDRWRNNVRYNDWWHCNWWLWYISDKRITI